MTHDTTRFPVALAAAALVLGIACTRRSGAGAEAGPDTTADSAAVVHTGTAWGPLNWGMSGEEVSRALGALERHGRTDGQLHTLDGAALLTGTLHTFSYREWKGIALVSPQSGLVVVQLGKDALPGGDDDTNRELLEVAGMPEDGVRQTREEIGEDWSFGDTLVTFNRSTEFHTAPGTDRTLVSEGWTDFHRFVGPSPVSTTAPGGGSTSDTGTRFDGVSGWIDLPWGTSIETARSALAAAGYEVEPSEVTIPVARSDGPERLDRGLSFAGRGRTGRLQFVEGHGLARADLVAEAVGRERDELRAWIERVHALLGDADQARLKNTLVWSTPTTNVTLTAGPDLPARVEYVPATPNGGTAEASP
ncbi:MAG: hypothetical protein JXB32_11710 [Deltaproteobacteria bacterium]|nr:hypothetical protein [Deltaproteobacteria bacterium]